MKTGFVIALNRACRVHGKEQPAGAVVECDATHADDLFLASRAAHAIQYRLADNGVNECAVIVSDGKHTAGNKMKWVNADGDAAAKLRKALDAAGKEITNEEAARQKIRNDRAAGRNAESIEAARARIRTLGGDDGADAAERIANAEKAAAAAAADVKKMKAAQGEIIKLRQKIDDELAKGDKADDKKIAGWESEIDDLLK